MTSADFDWPLTLGLFYGGIWWGTPPLRKGLFLGSTPSSLVMGTSREDTIPIKIHGKTRGHAASEPERGSTVHECQGGGWDREG